MDYFLKICVPILIIGACIDRIDSATADRSCHFCRENDGGPCRDNGNSVKKVRCDTLLYSRSTHYETFNNGENVGSDGNPGDYMGSDNGNGGGVGGELEARNGGRTPPIGATFQCVKERREYGNGGRESFLRTCVLDNFASNYCAAVRSMGETAIYDKFELKECHICDRDNCNFGNSLSISFVLISIVAGFLLVKAI